MYRKRLLPFLVGAVLLLAALACNAPGAQDEAGATLTQIAALALTPSPTTGTSTPTTDPANAIATDTPTPTVAPGVTPSPTVCTYNSIFVDDITIPDGTEMDPGQTFTKTWRMSNNGCQQWPSGTQLVFTDGNKMGAPDGVAVPVTAVGGSQDISVNMTAPTEPGEHRGRWQLSIPNVGLFGDKIFVEIVVREPTITPTPTETPTPTLTPTETEIPAIDFEASYTNSWSCGAFGRVSFQISNIGTEAIESVQFDIDGPVGTDISAGTTDTPFYASSTSPFPGCAGAGSDALDPGSSAYIRLEATSPGAGESGRVVLKMCTEDALGGECVQYTFDFTY